METTGATKKAPQLSDKEKTHQTDLSETQVIGHMKINV